MTRSQGGQGALGMELNLQVGLIGSLKMRRSLGLAIRWDCTLIMQMNSHEPCFNHDPSKALSWRLRCHVNFPQDLLLTIEGSSVKKSFTMNFKL